MSGVPIIVLKEGTEETREKQARKQNVSAVMAVAETIKSTLGPKGMAKMLVDSMGDTTITNDGAEILKALDLENVAAIMMVNLAKSIDEEIGDGTTSVVLFTAELMKNALELTEQNLPPKIITRGYELAAKKAIEIVNQISEKISKDDENIIKNVAKTSINAADISQLKDFFADIAFKAIKQVQSDENTYDKINNIKIVKAPGKSLRESKLIKGVYIQKEKLNSMMPDKLHDVKIAVIRKKMDISKTEYDAQIQIYNPTDIQKFLDQEEKILKNYLEIFKKLGIKMIVNNNDISDKFGAFLAREGIAAIKNVGESDYKAIMKATGAKLVDDVMNMTENDLGYAELVEFEKIDKDWYILFTGCKNPKAISILIKGGLDKVLDSAEIALHDVLSVVAKVIDTQKVIAGGGAIYIELAKRLRNFANEFSGKEQMAITVFANSLEVIPRILVINAGLDEIENMTALRAAHKTDEDKWIGIDTTTNEIGDNFKKGIVEPADLVIQIIKSGTELAKLILNIDRIIRAKSSEKHGFKP
ncbi:MAG: thermosome subunit beta [Promethearchaeota archaeon]